MGKILVDFLISNMFFMLLSSIVICIRLKTYRTIINVGEDKVVETDVVDEPVIREEDLVVKLPERERLERKKLEREKLERERLEHEKLEREKLEREKLEREKIDGEPSKHDDIDERELAIFKDECDPSCPRRISQSKYIYIICCYCRC
ncbi:hypothetical protein K0M31_019394 [Melipona bicolor]|uniref:Uncharacterized protein n=1 Tax=Melipona bicolor TaxID=60889 RepID=A0AA40G2D1_9HYME|nr:hypothetical protein K0M31_019394 [Melipona bicolor]